MLNFHGASGNYFYFSNGNNAVSVSRTSFEVGPTTPLSTLQSITFNSNPTTITVPKIYEELASTAFQTEEPTKPASRSYRVPKSVLASLEAAELSEDLKPAAQRYLSGTLTDLDIKELRSVYQQFNLQPVTSWTDRIVNALVASGSLEAEDTKPHNYEFNPKNPELCLICELPLEDSIHAPVSARDSEGSTKFFALFDEEDRVH